MKICISWDSYATHTKPYATEIKPNPQNKVYGTYYDLEGCGEIYKIDPDLATKLGMSVGECKCYELIELK